jgi:hypothetical protein
MKFPKINAESLVKKPFNIKDKDWDAYLALGV